MGGVFNLIKKLFSGIFSFIGGILGGNKSGYYMEAEPLPAKPAAKVEESKTEDAKSAVAAVKATVSSAADSVTEGVKEVAATTETTAKTAVKSKATQVESVTAEKAETNGSSNGANPLNLPQPTTSFATEYLVPKPTNTRRRPGANMSSYLEMAKTVKTPNN